MHFMGCLSIHYIYNLLISSYIADLDLHWFYKKIRLSHSTRLIANELHVHVFSFKSPPTMNSYK